MYTTTRYAKLPVWLSIIALTFIAITYCGQGGRMSQVSPVGASSATESDCCMVGNMIAFSFDRYQLKVPAGTYAAGLSYTSYQLDTKYVSSRYSVAVVGATADIGPGSVQLQAVSGGLSLNNLGLLSLRLLNPGTDPLVVADDFYVDVIMIERPVAPVAVVDPVVT